MCHRLIAIKYIKSLELEKNIFPHLYQAMQMFMERYFAVEYLNNIFKWCEQHKLNVISVYCIGQGAEMMDETKHIYFL